jgi:hypothetical protein
MQVDNMIDHFGIRKIEITALSKETFPGDYSYLRVPTSGWLIPEVFPHKICPLRRPCKSGLPSHVHWSKMLASQNELKLECNHGGQQLQVSAEVVYLTSDRDRWVNLWS